VRGDGRALYGTLLENGRAELAAGGGGYRVHRFLDLRSGLPALALTLGEPRGREPLLARVHSSCVTSEALGACDCDCAGQLDAALHEIARAGRGALFYLFQEGRGAGFAAKARDRMAVQASRERLTTFEAYAAMGLARDQRRYEEVGFLCHLLGIEAPLRLLTHNPEKAKALEDAGVSVADVLPLAPQLTAWNRHYLAAKSRSGHALADPGRAPGASPAEPLEPVAPAPADAVGRFVRVARYLLPVLTPGRSAPHWLTLELFYDLAARRERILLESRSRPGAAPRVFVYRENLLDRFAPRFGGARKPGWLAALRAFEAAGAGAALFLGSGDEALPDCGLLDLLCARAGRGAEALPGGDEALAGALAAALARAAAAG
jgi:GTP cyclohydrolase II